MVILAACWAFLPFYWAIITSFKPSGVILSKLSLVPFLHFEPTTANWENEYITRGKEITGALRNSLVIAGGATLIALVLGTMAGYGLARFRFHRWKNKDMTLRDVFKELPVELEEAALVDGASRFGTFLRIGLPARGACNRGCGGDLLRLCLERVSFRADPHRSLQGWNTPRASSSGSLPRGFSPPLFLRQSLRSSHSATSCAR